MNERMIFLSHIHEEKELAVLIKDAIEEEFSGFVNVFVSSDTKSIRTGENFLEKIQDGLANCAAAIYLISPNSAKRSWINFELGAVWLRSFIASTSGHKRIPAMPFCHSGMIPSEMPTPLNHLNGIECNKSGDLESAFEALQTALGGRGKLRTNFDELRGQVRSLERRFTSGAAVNRFIALFEKGMDLDLLRNTLKENAAVGYQMEMTKVPMGVVDRLKEAVAGDVNGLASINIGASGTSYGGAGATNYADVTISFSPDFVEILKSMN